MTNFGETELNFKAAVYDQNGKLLDLLMPPGLNPLKTRQQVSRFIHEYSSKVKGTFKGSMVLFAPDGNAFVTVGLVQSPGLLSVVPAVPGPYFTLPQ